MSDTPNPKRAKVEEALKAGPVGVRFTTGHPAVQAPEAIRKAAPSALLNFSPRFDPPDLVVDELGLSQTLSFGGSRERCFVPWEAIWSVEGKTDAGCGFFEESCPPVQVRAFFNQLMRQRLLLDRMARALDGAIKLYDENAGSGGWRRWRDSLRQTLGGETSAEKTARKLELVKG